MNYYQRRVLTQNAATPLLPCRHGPGGCKGVPGDPWRGIPVRYAPPQPCKPATQPLDTAKPDAMANATSRHTTCPQPHEPLLVGWIAGGMTTTTLTPCRHDHHPPPASRAAARGVEQREQGDDDRGTTNRVRPPMSNPTTPTATSTPHHRREQLLAG
jgi:hypothetical protein